MMSIFHINLYWNNIGLRSSSESKVYADKVIDSIISTEIPTKDAVLDKKELDSTVLPRLCRLTREHRNDQYGFDFKTLKHEGKHIANNVRDGLPAANSGLKEGDYKKIYI